MAWPTTAWGIFARISDDGRGQVAVADVLPGPAVGSVERLSD